MARNIRFGVLLSAMVIGASSNIIAAQSAACAPSGGLSFICGEFAKIISHIATPPG